MEIDWKTLLAGIIGGIIGGLLVYFLMPAKAVLPSQASATLNIGEVEISPLPANAVVVYKDESAVDRIKALKESGKLFLFQACSRGSQIGEATHYKEAYEKSLEEISAFLSSSVRSLTSLLKIQKEEFYANAVSIMSEGITAGSRIIAKYKYYDSVSYSFCVVTLYDPQAALMVSAVNFKLKKLAEEYGIEWGKFKEKLLEAYAQSYLPTE